MAGIPDEIRQRAALLVQSSSALLPSLRGAAGDVPLNRCQSGAAADIPTELGVVHEWMWREAQHAAWTVPYGAMIALCWRMLDAVQDGRVAWVGRHAWPVPRACIRRDGSRLLLERSLFIDPGTSHSKDERLWAVQQSLTCDGICAVVFDASGFSMVASRRLQLAAARGDGRPAVLALAVRPWHERLTPSAAATRWGVAPSPPSAVGTMAARVLGHSVDERGEAPVWTAELLRARGALAHAVGQCTHRIEATWSWSGASPRVGASGARFGTEPRP
ncbi:MAG: hypothetical protein FJ285_00160 [Planctomycetes bacterium]|nr:hypothetical protein [Planctomycetota bacterium]